MLLTVTDSNLLFISHVYQIRYFKTGIQVCKRFKTEVLITVYFYYGTNMLFV